MLDETHLIELKQKNSVYHKAAGLVKQAKQTMIKKLMKLFRFSN